MMKKEGTQAEILRQSVVGMRLRWHWMGRTRSVEDGMKKQMLATVEGSEGRRVDEDSYRATKMLYNPKLECFKNLSSYKGEIQRWWEEQTLPYVEPGVRLLPRAQIEAVNERLKAKLELFRSYTLDVQAERESIIADARQRLGSGFRMEDYPEDLSTLFGLEWAFVSVEPPSYLSSLCPQVYQQEQEKAAQAFREAIDLAQQAFLTEFKDVVDALHDRLTPNPDGTRKIFRDSVLTNILDFVEKFQRLNITGQSDIEQIAIQAKELLTNIEASDLRGVPCLRQDVLKGLGDIKNKLDPLLTNAPRRKILKKKEEPCAASGAA